MKLQDHAVELTSEPESFMRRAPLSNTIRAFKHRATLPVQERWTNVASCPNFLDIDATAAHSLVLPIS